MEETPRLRMFAGPNGSGKSTLKNVVARSRLGHYLNSDDILLELTSPAGYAVAGFPFTLQQSELDAFWKETSILPASERQHVPQLSNGRLHLSSPMPGHGAQALADLLRRRLLDSRVTFSFETVMSHISKVDVLNEAARSGYRTYLYYVATEDPRINIARVKARVALGGHSVPSDKVRSRYKRSLELLPEAIQACSRSFVFDNSTEDRECVWIAEFESGGTLSIKVDPEAIPNWFRNYVLRKLE